MTRTPGRALRRGFTMIELLVVMSIIAILATLITIASVRFIGTAREAATRTTIKKIDEAILERVNAVNRYHRRDISRIEKDWEFRGWTARWNVLGLDMFANTSSRNDARLVLSRKGMLRELLPVTVDELKEAYWFWAKFQGSSPSYITISGVPVPYLNASEQADMNTFLADIDTSGEVFFYALMNAPVFGGQRMTLDDFSSSELIDPDQDGVLELGDAWGGPIHFYRWPTRLVNNYATPTTVDYAVSSTLTWGDKSPRTTLMPNAPDSAVDLAVDADDRAGYLTVLHPLFKVPLAAVFHDPNTWHAPLVISAGPDKVLGLYEPNVVEGAAAPPGVPPVPPRLPGPRAGLAMPIAGQQEALFDNLTNHNGNGGL